MKWLLRIVVALVALYATFFAVIVAAMLQPPERFGWIMRHMPAPLVWGLLPGPKIWLWARAGQLRDGGPARLFSEAPASGAPEPSPP